MLEVLAGHASVALENARLYESQRREAESATALLEFTRDVSPGRKGIAEVAERAWRASARMLVEPDRIGLATGRRDGRPRPGLTSYAETGVAPETETTSTRLPLLGPWLGRDSTRTTSSASDHAAIAPPAA